MRLSHPSLPLHPLQPGSMRDVPTLGSKKQFPSSKNRETKAKYVWLKCEKILKGAKILDVGADKCHLKEYLDSKASYWGVGFGEVDLDKGSLPFEDQSYGCVLCLDVLEHLENIREVFDHLCRINRRHVIISLPNPWGMMTGRDHLKFYGSPVDRPEDRHRWFFSSSEAIAFIRYRAEKTGMEVQQLDHGQPGAKANSFRRLRWHLKTALLRPGLKDDDFRADTLWAVIEKK